MHRSPPEFLGHLYPDRIIEISRVFLFCIDFQEVRIQCLRTVSSPPLGLWPRFSLSPGATSQSDCAASLARAQISFLLSLRPSSAPMRIGCKRSWPGWLIISRARSALLPGLIWASWQLAYSFAAPPRSILRRAPGWPRRRETVRGRRRPGYLWAASTVMMRTGIAPAGSMSWP